MHDTESENCFLYTGVRLVSSDCCQGQSDERKEIEAPSRMDAYGTTVCIQIIDFARDSGVEMERGRESESESEREPKCLLLTKR